jgi:hypothetical protein
MANALIVADLFVLSAINKNALPPPPQNMCPSTLQKKLKKKRLSVKVLKYQ